MDNMTESSRLFRPPVVDNDSPRLLDLSVDVPGSSVSYGRAETDELVQPENAVTPSGGKNATAEALPPGLTVAHLMCEGVYLVILLCLCRVIKPIGEFTELSGGSEQNMDTFDAVTVVIVAYVIFQGVAVVGAMVAAWPCCRKVCGGYKGDRCGTWLYLVTTIFSSFLSVVELVVMTYFHIYIEQSKCEGIYRAQLSEVTKFRFSHKVVLLITTVVVVKLVLRLGAMAGASQRLCCPKIADFTAPVSERAFPPRKITSLCTLKHLSGSAGGV